MQATIFRYLSFAALIVGVIASFWMLRAGALCFLFAIACAHLAGTARAELHAKWTQETLFIVLNLLSQMSLKIDQPKPSEADTSGGSLRPEIDQGSKPKLRQVGDV
jgi:hypothetical protein